MISCLHTAQVHVETFDALMPGARHRVREDLLERARAHGAASVRDDLHAVLEDLRKGGPVLCSCSTLGPLVDEMGDPYLLRIDRPAMEAAVAAGAACSALIIVICLESTRDATLALFEEVAKKANGTWSAKLVLCERAWPYFEVGDEAGFVDAIVSALKGPAFVDTGVPVLLAQASMAAAAPTLEAEGRRVFTTPRAAAEAVLALDSQT